MSRKINEIAHEVIADWKNINYAAKPYLSAMMSLESLDDMYGYERAPGIIRYFLSNAKTWRGDVARRVKQELNHMIAGKY